LELLGFGGDGVQRIFAPSPYVLLVGEEVRQCDPAMAANQTIRNHTLLKQPDQVSPRYIEKFSSLVGGQLSADLQQADGIATRNLADRFQNETAKSGRQRECPRSAGAIFDLKGQFG